MNEKAVFFFPVPEKKNRLFKRVSEWLQTFSGKKKKQKSDQKMAEKKKKQVKYYFPFTKKKGLKNFLVGGS